MYKRQNEWSSNHDALLAAIDAGQYQEAVVLLTGKQPGTEEAGDVGASAYRELDADLQDLITLSRVSTREYITASLDATRLVSGAVALLSLLAVVCIWIGIRRRIGEFL